MKPIHDRSRQETLIQKRPVWNGGAPGGRPRQEAERPTTEQERPENISTLGALNEQLLKLDGSETERLDRIEDIIKRIDAYRQREGADPRVAYQMRQRIQQTLGRIKTENESIRFNINRLRAMLARQASGMLERLDYAADAISLFAPAFKNLRQGKFREGFKDFIRYGKLLVNAFFGKGQLPVAAPTGGEKPNPKKETARERQDRRPDSLSQIEAVSIDRGNIELRVGKTRYRMNRNGQELQYRDDDMDRFQNADEAGSIPETIQDMQSALEANRDHIDSIAAKLGQEGSEVFKTTMAAALAGLQVREEGRHPNAPEDIAEFFDTHEVPEELQRTLPWDEAAQNAEAMAEFLEQLHVLLKIDERNAMMRNVSLSEEQPEALQRDGHIAFSIESGGNTRHLSVKYDGSEVRERTDDGAYRRLDEREANRITQVQQFLQLHARSIGQLTRELLGTEATDQQKASLTENLLKHQQEFMRPSPENFVDLYVDIIDNLANHLDFYKQTSDTDNAGVLALINGPATNESRRMFRFTGR